MVTVYVYTPSMNPIQTVYFANAYKAEEFIDGVRKNGYFVKVFVGDSTVEGMGE